ncbi:radical SAM protein [candidate division WOR-3 bacterium]|nr:radical SAM protein [candidate division WOR-3 bacterium]
MKRLLLVNPWIHDFAAFDFWLKPLGLLRIAGALRDAGVKVYLLDLLDRNHPWLEKRTKTDEWGRGKFFAEEIEKPWILEYVPRKFRRYGLPYSTLVQRLSDLPDADAILITSGMTYWYTGVAETIRVLRKRYPGIPVILGGIYASLLPEHAWKNSEADVVLKGGLAEIKERLEKLVGLHLPEETPFPAWDLYSKLDYAVMSISRGCPFRCTYCASHRLESRYLPRNLEDITAELKYLADLKIRRIAFYDDAMLFHPQFDEIMRQIIKMDAGLELHTPNGLHVSQITPERAELMKQAGFRSMYLSLETVDEELLASTGAKLSPDAFTQAVRILKDAGFSDELGAYVLFGLPGQSEDSVKRTLDLALSEGVKPHLAEFSPVPGTLDFTRSELGDDTDPLLSNNTAWCNQEKLRDSWRRLKDYLEIMFDKSS